LGTPSQLRSLAGQEHGRTIPLVEINRSLASGWCERKSGRYMSRANVH